MCVFISKSKDLSYFELYNYNARAVVRYKNCTLKIRFCLPKYAYFCTLENCQNMHILAGILPKYAYFGRNRAKICIFWKYGNFGATRCYFVFQARHLEHANIVRFVGACVDVPNVALVTENCPKGSLQVIFSFPSGSFLSTSSQRVKLRFQIQGKTIIIENNNNNKNLLTLIQSRTTLLQ